MAEQAVWNRQSISLVWYAAQVGQDEGDTQLAIKFESTKAMLREIVDSVQVLSSSLDCIEKLIKMRETIILVISNSSDVESLLGKVHMIRHVDTVFFFDLQMSSFEQSFLDKSKYRKIAGPFDNPDSFKAAILQTIRDIEKQSIVLSYYDPSKQKSVRSLEHDAGSFIWLQLIREVVQKLPASSSVSAKDEMLSKCRLYYRDNRKELENIDHFEKSYQADQAIHWYTTDSFIFKLINKALRTDDVEALCTYRFYIVDLCSQLMEEHHSLVDNWNPYRALKLYRGVKQSSEEIAKLKNSIGQLICTNTFFSTSRSVEIAKIYGGFDQHTTDLECVLFEIDVPDLSTCVLDDVSCSSQFPDEEEVLFDLGTVFEVVEVSSVDPSCWICRMIPSTKGRAIAQTYMDLKRKEIRDGNVVILLGTLLWEMGEHKKAQAYWTKLFETMPHNVDVLSGLARSYFTDNHFDKSLNLYRRALRECNRKATDVYYQISSTQINTSIGLVHYKKGDYAEALQRYAKTLEMCKKISDIDQLEITTVLRYIGLMHFRQGAHDLALSNFDRVREIVEEVRPFDSPQLCEAHFTVAMAFYLAGNFKKSSESLEASLQMATRIFPNHCHAIAIRLNCKGKLLYKHGDYEAALELHQSCLTMTRPDDLTAIVKNSIGKVCCRLKQFNVAEELYNEALVIYTRIYSSADHFDIAYTLKNMGELFLVMGDFKQALNYLHQARRMYQRLYPNLVQPDIAKCQCLVGLVHVSLNDDGTAQTYFRRALDIWQRTLGGEHPDRALCMKKFSQLRWRLVRRHVCSVRIRDPILVEY